ncbi:MAG: 30S ribosomal protein S18 [Chloroflexi bacterium RBG_16_50_9]|nr:MAG: 30S ribosomal protein S18 [Chloroflexi bacterium RBG_16_50_9]
MVQTREARFRRPGRPKYIPKRKVCAFCQDKVEKIDYKDTNLLRSYITDRGKITPRRKSGACAKHQRRLAMAIKRARHLAMLPYVAAHIRKTGGVGLRS